MWPWGPFESWMPDSDRAAAAGLSMAYMHPRCASERWTSDEARAGRSVVANAAPGAGPEGEEPGLALPLPPVCKHWLRRGACLFGDPGGGGSSLGGTVPGCFFRHPEEDRGIGAPLLSGDGWGGDRRRRNTPRHAAAARLGTGGRGAGAPVGDVPGPSSHARRTGHGRGNRSRARVVRALVLGRLAPAGGWGEDPHPIEGTRPNRPLSGAALDVAGGSGELAFLLAALDGWTSVVLEPRTPRFDRFLRRHAAGHYTRNAALMGGAEPPSLSSMPPPLPAPGHVRSLLTLDLAMAVSRLVAAAGGDRRRALEALEGGATSGLEDGWPEALAVGRAAAAEAAAAVAGHDWAAGHEGLGGKRPLGRAGAFGAGAVTDDDDDNEGDGDGGNGGAVVLPSGDPPDAILRHLLSATVVVAVHPDRATEPAVRLALGLGAPFVVVPCCVFPNTPEGKRRRLGDDADADADGGARVVTDRSIFCRWLLRLAQAAGWTESGIEELPFSGANGAVWGTPPGWRTNAERVQPQGGSVD